jgi:GMP synthase (glutamine-hydrolysing)
VLVVEHEPGAGLDLMAAPLTDGAARAGARIDVVRPYLGASLPQDAQGLAGLVVLGGEMGALDDDDAPWLPATRALLASAVRASTPTLGICLGAQLLGAATGGRVERGAAGLEVGLAAVSPLPAAARDPYLSAVLGAEPGPYDVLQYHRDVVAQLPPDAELLVTGDQYPHQAFRVGAAAWGVQYHPEVSAGGFASWMTSAAPEDAAAARAAGAGIAARPDRAGRQDLADAHALGLLAAATLVP